MSGSLEYVTSSTDDIRRSASSADLQTALQVVISRLNLANDRFSNIESRLSDLELKLCKFGDNLNCKIRTMVDDKVRKIAGSPQQKRDSVDRFGRTVSTLRSRFSDNRHVSDDMGGDRRDVKARYAGHLLYNSLSSQSSSRHNSTNRDFNSSLNSGTGSIGSSLPWDQRACCGIMSPVRRTFCLFLLFDLVLSFLLWVIFSQIASGDLHKSLITTMVDQMTHYTFRESLFDIVLCAAWRFAPLLLAYALFRINNPWAVAVTTATTCIFLLCKVFIFNFKQKGNNEMSYVLLVVAFVICWAETWFLDFKVLPREQKAREREALYRSIQERGPLLDDPGFNYQTRDQYYSPVDSREGSDDELLDPEGGDDDFRSLPGTRTHSRKSSGSFNLTLGDQEQEYREKAKEVWDTAWQLAQDDEDWKLEGGSDVISGCVHSKKYPDRGKVYRLKGTINCNPKMLFHELVLRISTSPRWNRTVEECRVLHVIDDTTDVLYSVAAEAAGGVISSRDFVNIRHWGTRDGVLVSCGCSVTHPAMPPHEKHVRGENGPGIFVFDPVIDEPGKCNFSSYINTDLKGWIPQYVVDQVLANVLLEYLQAIRNHMAELLSTSLV